MTVKLDDEERKHLLRLLETERCNPGGFGLTEAEKARRYNRNIALKRKIEGELQVRE